MRYLSLGQQRILFALAFLLLIALYFQFYHRSSTSIPKKNVREFVVEVEGEVRRPGIYIFETPPTLKQAIEKAGDLKEPAEFDQGASSEILGTGTLLTVTKEPSIISPSSPHPSPLPPGERAQGEGPLLRGNDGGMKRDQIRIKIRRMAASKLLVFSIPLDLNQATAEDLRLIPGIGESSAQEIVDHRERRKGFRSVEELKNIKGIGEKTFQSIKPYLAVSP